MFVRRKGTATVWLRGLTVAEVGTSTVPAWAAQYHICRSVLFSDSRVYKYEVSGAKCHSIRHPRGDSMSWHRPVSLPVVVFWGCQQHCCSFPRGLSAKECPTARKKTSVCFKTPGFINRERNFLTDLCWRKLCLSPTSDISVTFLHQILSPCCAEQGYSKSLFNTSWSTALERLPLLIAETPTGSAGMGHYWPRARWYVTHDGTSWCSEHQEQKMKVYLVLAPVTRNRASPKSNRKKHTLCTDGFQILPYSCAFSHWVSQWKESCTSAVSGTLMG